MIVIAVFFIISLNTMVYTMVAKDQNKQSMKIHDAIPEVSSLTTGNPMLWNIEYVDTNHEVGWYSTIKTREDVIFISYYDLAKGDLRFVSRVHGQWNTEIVDESGDVGSYNYLVLDSTGAIHISYYDRTNGDLKYAKKTGETWHIETIDEDGTTGRDTSIAIDSNDKVHISYYDETKGHLKHAASNKDGAWDIEIVDDNGDIGAGSAIDISDNDIIHISYADRKNGHLWHAESSSSGWQITEVDTECILYGSTSISIDSNGQPHICYYHVPNPSEDWTLKYATRQKQNWMVEIIDPDLKYFWYDWGCSIDVDSFDRVHVAYYAWNKWNLNYALKTGNEWDIEVVESDGSVGGYASVTVDDSGYSHISYMDMNDLSLKHAEKINYKPEKPRTPIGRRIGVTQQQYQYQTVTDDFEHEMVSYGWDWGNGEDIEWTPYYPSSEIILMNHSWLDTGTYSVRVKAKDMFGSESLWSDSHQVSIPKKRNRNSIRWLIDQVIMSHFDSSVMK